MTKITRNAPHLYACRTGKNGATKIFHLFVLLPIAKSKNVRFWNNTASIVENGFSYQLDEQGIHFQLDNEPSSLGEKIVTAGQTYWGIYISFKYSEGNYIDESSQYAFTVNIHKANKRKPEKKITIYYEDAEEIEAEAFNLIKDGEFASDCPYVYLNQMDKKDMVNPITLVPTFEQLELVAATNNKSKRPSSIEMIINREVKVKQVKNVDYTVGFYEAIEGEEVLVKTRGDNKSKKKKKKKKKRHKMKIRFKATK